MNVPIDIKDINFLVTMKDINELFKRMDNCSTAASEMLDSLDSRYHTLGSCEAYFEQLNKKYLEGRSVREYIQDAIKACAQKKTIGTEVKDEHQLYDLLCEKPSPPKYVKKEFIYWGSLYVVLREHFADFQALFQYHLPKAFKI